MYYDIESPAALSADPLKVVMQEEVLNDFMQQSPAVTGCNDTVAALCICMRHQHLSLAVLITLFHFMSLSLSLHSLPNNSFPRSYFPHLPPSLPSFPSCAWLDVHPPEQVANDDLCLNLQGAYDLTPREYDEVNAPFRAVYGVRLDWIPCGLRILQYCSTVQHLRSERKSHVRLSNPPPPSPGPLAPTPFLSRLALNVVGCWHGKRDGTLFPHDPLPRPAPVEPFWAVHRLRTPRSMCVLTWKKPTSRHGARHDAMRHRTIRHQHQNSTRRD